MMAKTHISIGVATSLLLLYSDEPSACLAAIAGGALGGVVADIDAVKNDSPDHDALKGQIYAILIALVCFVIGLFVNNAMIKNVERQFFSHSFLVGIIGYILFYIIGFFSHHRTFTHSILALTLFSLSICLIAPELMKYYIAGYASHLIIDLTNKKNVPIFFPFGKGFCLKWFYAGKVANTVFMWIGIIVSFILMTYFFVG